MRDCDINRREIAWTQNSKRTVGSLAQHNLPGDSLEATQSHPLNNGNSRKCFRCYSFDSNFKYLWQRQWYVLVKSCLNDLFQGKHDLLTPVLSYSPIRTMGLGSSQPDGFRPLLSSAVKCPIMLHIYPLSLVFLC